MFEEGERFWLAEGFHRLEAFTAAGFAEAPCDVRRGGLRDAILHSAGANADHGVRRSISDRRRAVLMLVQDEEWGGWSDREIARRCAVSADLVGTVRRELTVGTDSEPATRAYRDRHGNVSQMRTDRIGRKAEAEPSAPAEDEAQAERPAAAESPGALAAEPELPFTQPEAGNVVRLGSRLAIMPSLGSIERAAVIPGAIVIAGSAEQPAEDVAPNFAGGITGAIRRPASLLGGMIGTHLGEQFARSAVELGVGELEAVLSRHRGILVSSSSAPPPITGRRGSCRPEAYG